MQRILLHVFKQLCVGAQMKVVCIVVHPRHIRLEGGGVRRGLVGSV